MLRATVALDVVNRLLVSYLASLYLTKRVDAKLIHLLVCHSLVSLERDRVKLLHVLGVGQFVRKHWLWEHWLRLSATTILVRQEKALLSVSHYNFLLIECCHCCSTVSSTLLCWGCWFILSGRSLFLRLTQDTLNRCHGLEGEAIGCLLLWCCFHTLENRYRRRVFQGVLHTSLGRFSTQRCCAISLSLRGCSILCSRLSNNDVDFGRVIISISVLK